MNLPADRHTDQEGFTLIELLIVVVILGILAAIVVFSVTGVNNTSKVSACKTDIKTIDTAAEAYFAQNSTNPATMAALVTGGFLHTSSSTGASTVPGTSTDPNLAAVNADAGIANNLEIGSGYTVLFVPGGSAYPANAFWSTHTGNAPGAGDAISDLANCP